MLFDTLLTKRTNQGDKMIKYIFLCIVIGLSIMAWSEIPIKRGPGILAEEAPKISKLISSDEINFNGHTYTTHKKIDARVRVVEKERYFFDSMSEFSSYDILVGWGQVSDQKNLDYINFKLSDRTFEYKNYRLPLDPDLINNQTLLWHLIPSSEEIKNSLFTLRKGHIIEISGYIVDVTTKTGLQWKSATSPSKSESFVNGHNIFWVTSLIKK